MTGAESPPFPSGIWPAQRLEQAIARGEIRIAGRPDEDQVQPASLDLRLGEEGWRIPASFLPGRGATVADRLARLGAERLDLGRDTVLRRGEVYLVRLLESLDLGRRIAGLANPKSSTGRLDVFCRVITDFGTEFDAIPAGYRGPLWLEIAPRSFHILVRRGSRLAQIRIRQGSPRGSHALIDRLNREIGLIRGAEGPADVKQGAIALSVDLAGRDSDGLVGYRAKATPTPVDIDRRDYYEIAEFWQEVARPADGLVLEPDTFHILSTAETVAVPDSMAADMIAYDTLVGEFRVHYAGFFDPGFGYSGGHAEGTRIVLEMRSHEVPFILEHGQIVGRVLVERLTEPTDRPYGSRIGSNYVGQGLTLGKQFRRRIFTDA